MSTYMVDGKKMMNICILEILRKYTDSEHTMDQKDIIKKLETEYGMKVDRKSVKSNLMNLVDFGYNLECTEIERENKNGETEILTKDWYYNHEFDDAELRMLIDSILFSKTIPRNQAQELIEKIKGLSNVYFSAKVQHVCNLPGLSHTDNRQTMLNVEMIDDAISEGKYYLICNYDKYDNLSNYRIDRMTEIEILDEKVKDKSLVKGMEHGLNLPQHMAEHLYMFSDPAATIVLKVQKGNMGDIVDWFDKNFEVLSPKFVQNNYPDNFNPETDANKAFIRVTCSQNAMFHWAMQYGTSVEVIEPADLRERIRDAVNEMAERYK